MITSLTGSNKKVFEIINIIVDCIATEDKGEQIDRLGKVLDRLNSLVKHE